mgnify:CR=1 FL=1
MDRMNVNEKELEFFLGQEYPVFLRPLSEEEGGGWFAEIPDLPGCMSDGETREEALKNLDEAKRAWITAALEQGQKVPLPKKEEDEYSGKLTLRMPKVFHRELARTAEKERVSLNQLILNLISFGYGALFGKLYRKPARMGIEIVCIESSRPLPASLKSESYRPFEEMLRHIWSRRADAANPKSLIFNAPISNEAERERRRNGR